jgi:hypothetical protein
MKMVIDGRNTLSLQTIGHKTIGIEKKNWGSAILYRNAQTPFVARLKYIRKPHEYGISMI